MAFNVSSIAVFTDQIKNELIMKAVISNPTMDLVTVMPGVKYSQALNILTNTVDPKAATCTWQSNGSVAFSQRNIVVSPLEVKESLCMKTIEQYWLGMKMKAGAQKEDSLGPILAESYVKNIQAKNEYNIWQGNYSGSTSYTLFNGFLKTIVSEATRLTVPTLTGVTITTSNVIASVETMWSNVPSQIRDMNDLTLFMSLGDFDIYAQALRTANLYHFDSTQDGIRTNVINYIPGLKVIGLAGMIGAKTSPLVSGINPWVLTYATNLVVGTDLVNEEEKFDIWYSRDNDDVRVNIQWKLGTQVQFPELIVTNF